MQAVGRVLKQHEPQPNSSRLQPPMWKLLRGTARSCWQRSTSGLLRRLRCRLASSGPSIGIQTPRSRWKRSAAAVARGQSVRRVQRQYHVPPVFDLIKRSGAARKAVRGVAVHAAGLTKMTIMCAELDRLPRNRLEHARGSRERLPQTDSASEGLRSRGESRDCGVLAASLSGR